MVFKKDITPFGRGQIVKHKGKGASERKPDVMARTLNRYPKVAPEPMGPMPASGGLTPPFGIGRPPDEE